MQLVIALMVMVMMMMVVVVVVVVMIIPHLSKNNHNTNNWACAQIEPLKVICARRNVLCASMPTSVT